MNMSLTLNTQPFSSVRRIHGTYRRRFKQSISIQVEHVTALSRPCLEQITPFPPGKMPGFSFP